MVVRVSARSGGIVLEVRILGPKESEKVQGHERGSPRQIIETNVGGGNSGGADRKREG